MIIISGVAAGLAVSVPAAIVYAKKAIAKNTQPFEAGSSIQQPTVITDTVNLNRIKISSSSVYRNKDKNTATFDLTFEITDNKVNQVGIGIVDCEVTWVHINNPSKSKLVNENQIKTRVCLIEKDKSTKISVPVTDEKNMKISHAKLKIYEGGVGKTQNIQLKIEDYTFTDR